MEFFTTQKFSTTIGTSDTYIRKKVSKAKKDKHDFIFIKGKKFFFRKRLIGKGYEFFEISFEDAEKKNCTINIDIKVDIDTEIEDLNLNIKVNGIKVN